jgi:hypothetical protein
MKGHEEREYMLPESLVGIHASALKRVDETTQIDVMRTWFLQNYETPEQNTPYDSGEGGYVFIWGGPFDPKEELEKEFVDIVPNETIAKAAEKLTALSGEWTSKPGRGDLIDYLVQEIVDIEFYKIFQTAIYEITRLIEASVDPLVRNSFNRLLYAQIITALESFLSGAFITIVLNEPDAMRKFVETTPEFQKEKISVSEIYHQMGGLRERVIKYLGDMIWHNLPKVKEMYKATLGIDFPPNLGDVIRAITVRHDIVHRNGKTKDGKEHLISLGDISELLRCIESLVLRINTKLGVRKIRSETPPGNTA